MNDNDTDIIFEYARKDAIEDGIFIDVTDTAKEAGIRFPVAVTSNLWHSHIGPNDETDSKGRLWDLLFVFRSYAKRANDSFMEFTVIFGGKTVTVWAVCEAISSKDPSPAITIMLPEDY